MPLSGTGIAVRVWFLLAFPLIMLIVGLVDINHTRDGETALIFFMLLSFVLYPLGWILGKFSGLYDVDNYYVIPEMIWGGLVFGFILPVIILTPIYLEADLGSQNKDMVLAYIIMLSCIWIPIPIAIFWAPLIEEPKFVAPKDLSPDAPPPEPHLAAGPSYDNIILQFLAGDELNLAYFAIFTTFCIPLGFFLPLLLNSDSEPGQTALVFFLLLTSLLGFFFLLAPRLALLVDLYELRVSEAAIKFVGGAIIYTLLILLPIYFESGIAGDPQRMLLAFIVALPSVSAIEAVRVLNREDRDLLYPSESVLLALIVLPLGFFLPIWLAVDPGCGTQIALLVLMLTPTLLLLSVVLYITCVRTSSLPFYPLNWLMLERESWVEFVYVAGLILFSLVLLLPIFFHGDLCNESKLLLVSYMGVFMLLLAIAFYISFASGQHKTPVVDPAAVKKRQQNGRRRRAGPIVHHQNGRAEAMNFGPAHKQFSVESLEEQGHPSAPTNAAPYYEPEPDASLTMDWEPASRWEIEPNQGSVRFKYVS